jgi:hypothetical protein
MSEIYVPPKVAGEEELQAAQESREERKAILEVDAGMAPEEALEKAKSDLSKANTEDPLEVESAFLNQWVTSIAKATDASRPLVIFSAIGLLSALCHNFYFCAPREVYLNLFLFILGQSTVDRKTTLLDMVRDYLAEVAPELILPNEFTPEALFACLAKRNHGTVFSRELNSWLDQMLGPDYNKGLSSTLGNIYDHAKYITRQTKKDGLLTIEDPVITVIGAGVMEYLIAHLREMDMVSGFWPRVTLVQLSRQNGKAYRSPGRFEIEYHILEKLRALARQEGGEIKFDKIAHVREAYAAELFREAEGLGNANLASGYARLEWILVKIAALLQLADNPISREIEPAACHDAIILVDYIKKYLPDFYDERIKAGPESKLAEWALKFIKKRDKNGTVWVPYRTILQHSHADAGKLQSALGRLLATEECEQTETPANKAGGRTGKAYRRGQC